MEFEKYIMMYEIDEYDEQIMKISSKQIEIKHF